MFQIITHITDTDKYKFTMLQEILFSASANRKVKWKFTNRTVMEGRNLGNMKKEFYHQDVLKELVRQIKLMDGMKMTQRELDFLQSDKFHKTKIIKDEFITFLKSFKLKSSCVKIDGDDITVEGTWVETTLWETYLLSMYNEIFTALYSKLNNINITENNAINIRNKVNLMKGREGYDFNFVEFGTRRRASKDIQLYNIKQLMTLPNFCGTSNMYFAMLLNIDCGGTIAHEKFIFNCAFAFVDGNSVTEAHKNTLIEWNKFYDGELNTFLSDTFGTDYFLKDYKDSGVYLDERSSVRHDSGDPIEFAIKMKKFYEKNNIEPSSRVIMFSDGLDIEKAKYINKTTSAYCIPIFGIGTNFTNDCGGFPLSIVCKPSSVYDESLDKWVSTVKLSDNINKAIGEPEMIKYYKDIFNYVNKETNNETLVY